MHTVPSPSGPTLIERVAEIEAGIDRVAERTGLPLDGALLFRLLVLVGHELSTVLDDMLGEQGLNDTEFRTLMMLFSRPDGVASPSDLCISVSQSPANMTRVADQLLERGLITRTPSDADRRRTILHITPQGEALARQFMPRGALYTDMLLGHLSPAERQQLVQQLKHICTRIDALPQTLGPAS